MENDSQCAHCGQNLKGRTDKRFCNDTCRNTYNRKQRQEKHVPFPEQAKEIIDIIKQNYQLIAHKNGTDRDVFYFAELKGFIDKGFDPSYFTNIHIAEDGQKWCCIFDWCFRLDGDLVAIKDFPELLK